MSKVRIILVDDHSLVRGGIKSLIEKESSINIIGEASSGLELFDLLQDISADIVILDISMPGMSGIEVTKKLKEEYPEIKVLILSMYTQEDFIHNAIAAGAFGYLPKNTTKQDLITAIEAISKGSDYFSKEISEILLSSYLQKTRTEQKNDLPSIELLTRRELEILKLVVDGVSNQTIADKLFISIRTVESHKTHILQKLKLSNMAELIKFALKNKLTNID